MNHPRVGLRHAAEHGDGFIRLHFHHLVGCARQRLGGIQASYRARGDSQAGKGLPFFLCSFLLSLSS
jgi:hypothetical protein